MHVNSRLLKNIFSLSLLSTIAVILSYPLSLAANPSHLHINYPKPKTEYDTRADYYLKLLKLALDNTSSQGDYTIHFVEPSHPEKRTYEALNSNDLTMTIAMATHSNEQTMQAIRFPLTRGLIGYRILAIHKDSQTQFNAINSEDELKALKGGLPHYWADYDIFSHNGYNVKGLFEYGKGFDFVDNKKIDYFPRGILEIQQEINDIPQSNLVSDTHLLIIYPAAIYFFVSRENHSLAQRIEIGLMKAQKNGQFDALFRSYIFDSAQLTKKKIQERRIIRLKNNQWRPDETVSKQLITPKELHLLYTQ